MHILLLTTGYTGANKKHRLSTVVDISALGVNTSDPYDKGKDQVQRLVILSQKPIKEKCLSWRYLHTYNLYYSHIYTGDPNDEIQGQVHGWVSLTCFFQGPRQ